MKQQPKILIVEDSRHFQNLYEQFLPDYDLAIAKTLEDGLKLISVGFDLAILDLVLPDSKSSTYERFKEKWAGPLIVISGEKTFTEDEIFVSKECFTQDFLQKAVSSALSQNSTDFKIESALEDLKKFVNPLYSAKKNMDIDQLTKKLQDAEERRRLALDESFVGIWDWGIESGDLIWDANMYNIYDVPKDEFEGLFDSWAERVHPEDIVSVRKSLEACLSDPTLRYFARFRIKHRESWRFISGVGNCIRDENDKPIRVVGINILEPELCESHYQNITKKKPCESCPSKFYCAELK